MWPFSAYKPRAGKPGNRPQSVRLCLEALEDRLCLSTMLAYSTYLGGTGSDVGTALAVDANGNAYIAGTTSSTNFPTTSGALQTTAGGGFVTKLNAAGTGPTYSTYLPEGVHAIAVDSSGDAYVLETENTNDTASGYQTTIIELNPAGTALLYSITLSGARGTGIAVDASGDAYVTGTAVSSAFPTTPGSYGTTGTGPFITKINPTGSGLIYSTILNSPNSVANAIALDAAGDAYVTGQAEPGSFPTTPGAFLTSGSESAFVTELNPSGSGLVYSTFLSSAPTISGGYGIAVNAATGNAFLTGYTSGSGFPTTPGAFQSTLPGPTKSPGAFMTELNAAGSGLVYSTLLGGNYSYGYGIALDAAGNVYLTGKDDDSSFPVTNAFQRDFATSFVSEIDPNQVGAASLIYSSYLGSANIGNAIAVDAAGNTYVTGQTTGGMVTTITAFQNSYSGGTDAFVTKIRNLGDSAAFAITGSSKLETAGVPDTYTVTAENVAGGINTGYTGTIHFTSSDPLALLPPDYTFTPADHGVHTFSITVETAGSQSIAATDLLSDYTSSQFSIPVSPAVASTLSITGYPSPTNVGLPGTFTVTAFAPYGNLATSYTGTVRFTSSDASAVLSANYTFSAADAGQHTFNATLNTPGSQSIAAIDTVTGTIMGSESGITVNPAGQPAATLSLTGFSSPTLAGTAGTLTVTVRDANGNVAPSYRGTIHFSSSDAQGLLPANYTFTNTDQGVHTFTVTLKTAKTQSITATDTVTGTIKGSESGIVVKPAAAADFVLSAPSNVTKGTAFSVTLTVEDAYGNVVTGYLGTVNFSSSDSTAILPGNYNFAAADAGVHTFVNEVTLKKKGTRTLTVTDTVNSALTATDSLNVS